MEDVYSNITRLYETIRNKNSDLEQRRKSEINTKLPRIAEINAQLKELSVSLARLALTSLEKQEKESKIEEFGKAVEALNNEKTMLLEKNGYPKNYLDPIYTCKICRDTGNDGLKKCSCFHRYISRQNTKLSGVSEILEKENFDTFDPDVYSKQIPEGKKLSPYDNVKQVIADIKPRLAAVSKNSPCNFIFSGKTGVGKTFLCNCAAKELLDKGLTLHYVSAFQLFKDMSDSYFNNKSTYDQNDVMNCDVLVIDDLGAEVKSSVTKACFLDIINQRVRNGGSTLISSNYSLSQLFDVYEERIGSRFAQHYRLYNLYGEDIRMI